MVRSDDFIAFSNRLKTLRVSLGMTQADLAHHIAVETSLISHWEHGRRFPDAPTLSRLILVFKEAGVPDIDLNSFWKFVENTAPQIRFDYSIVSLVASTLGDARLTESERQDISSELASVIDQYRRFIAAKRHFEERKWQRAYDNCEEVLEYNQNIAEKSRVKPLIMQAACSYRLGKYHEATDRYHAALFILGNDTDNIELPKIHVSLGSIYRRLGQWELADEHFNQAKNIYISLGDDIGIATALRSLAGNLLYQGNARPAIVLCQSAIGIFRSKGDTRGEYRSIQHLGWALALSGDIITAIEHHRSMLEKIKEMSESDVQIAKSIRYYADSCLNYTEYLDDFGQQTWIKLAGQLYSEALSIIDNLPGSERERGRLLKGEVLFGLGKVSVRLKERIKAQDLLRQAEVIHRELGEQMRLGLTLQEQGRLFAQLENTRSAEVKLDEAERIFHRLSNNYHRALVISDLAQIRSRSREDEDRALDDVKRGMEIIGEQEYFLPIAWLQVTAGIVWARKRNLPEAIRSFSSSIITAHGFSALLVERVVDELYRAVSGVANLGYLEDARNLEESVFAILPSELIIENYGRLKSKHPS